METYRLIVGLGNPGREYAKTRHNIGFLLADTLLRDKELAASEWSQKEGYACADAVIVNHPVRIIKPLQYMNRSGAAVVNFTSFFKISPNQIIVCHDDIDLTLGTIRIKMGGGDGGHNGVSSVAESLGTKDFLRVRLGVGRPINPQYETKDWVLGNFSSEESPIVAGLVERGVLALKEIFKSGHKTAQAKFN